MLNSPHAGNSLMRGGGVALLLEGPEMTGVNVTRFDGNFIQLDGAQNRLPRAFHKSNMTTLDPNLSSKIIRQSLNVLESWTQKRAGLVVIKNPDGECCIASPSSHNRMMFELPAAQTPKHIPLKSRSGRRGRKQA
jgi:hypothetical protein